MPAADTTYYFHQQPDSVSLPAVDIAQASCLHESPWAEMSDTTYAPSGIDAPLVPYTLTADTGAVGMLLFLFVLGVWLFSRSWHYMSNAATEFFFSRNHSNIYDAGNPESVLHGGFPLFLFVALSMGLTLYVAFGGLAPQGLADDGRLWFLADLSHVQALLLSVGLVALVVAVKVVLLQMVNSTFFTPLSRQIWRDGLRLVWLLLGVVLWLTCLAAVFFGLSAHGVLWTSVLVIAVAKLLILIKTKSAFFPKASELSRLILYFCTLELAPSLFLIAFLTHQ